MVLPIPPPWKRRTNSAGRPETTSASALCSRPRRLTCRCVNRRPRPLTSSLVPPKGGTTAAGGEGGRAFGPLAPSKEWAASCHQGPASSEGHTSPRSRTYSFPLPLQTWGERSSSSLVERAIPPPNKVGCPILAGSCVPAHCWELALYQRSSVTSVWVCHLSCQGSDWQNKNRIDHPRTSPLESTHHNMYITIPLQFLQPREDSNWGCHQESQNNYSIAYFERAEFVFLKSKASFQTRILDYSIRKACGYQKCAL